MFSGPFDTSIVKRACDAKLLTLTFVDLRTFGIGSRRTVDDTLYGGGTGMLIRVDVGARALAQAGGHRIHLTPHGTLLTQKKVQELAESREVSLLCGHYEGIDARITHFVDEEISIGNYVLTGGELPAMVLIDAIARLIPGVLQKEAVSCESFGDFLLEYPQYTRPRSYQGYRVPSILFSGDHVRIADYRRRTARTRTKRMRPDLFNLL